jgi:hypothetical protein
VVPKPPQQVITMMARRPMRQHHYLWHTARNNWLRFPDDVKAVFRRLGWEPPRPAVDAGGAPIETNDSGEDFLVDRAAAPSEQDFRESACSV